MLKIDTGEIWLPSEAPSVPPDAWMMCAAGTQPNSTRFTSGGPMPALAQILGKELGQPRPQGAFRVLGPE